MPYTKKKGRQAAFGRKGYKSLKKYNRIKKLVTGEGPSLLEKIAAGVGGVATVAKAVLPAIAAINTEAKYFDVSVTGGLFPGFAAPTIAILSNTAQGITDTTRIGNSLLAKNIKVRVDLHAIFTTQNYQIFRLMLISDKLQGGVPPTLAQLVTDVTNINSQHNKNYTDRFVTLKDETIVMNQTHPLITSHDVSREIYFPLNFHMRYLGATGGALDQGPNAIYLVIWPGDPVTLQASQYYSRLNYTDN